MGVMSTENYVRSLHGAELDNIIAGMESMLDVALNQTSTKSLKGQERLKDDQKQQEP